MISTGTRYLDKLVGGIRLGDNVVWQISNAVPVEYFIKSFFTISNAFQNTVIYVNFNCSPHALCKRYEEIFTNYNFIVIDAFTHGKGNSDPVFLDFYQNETDFDVSKITCIKDPRDIKSFTTTMNQIQRNNRDGSFYIFDSLTGMNELWKDERAVLDFFAFACPKLYEMNTIAYWVLEQEAHTREFIAGLTHITQVVLSICNTNSDYYALRILKLEDRPPVNSSVQHMFRIIDRDIHFEETENDILRIGGKVKELRKSAGITQAELASKLRMTPGAISQIENDLIAPSLNTLIRLAMILRKPIEYFINTEVLDSARKGYTLFRKKDASQTFIKNIKIERLYQDQSIGIVPYYITLGGKEAVEGPILPCKGREFVLVVNGVLSVTINGEEYLLRKGESIHIDQAFVERWSNHGKNNCEIIYIQL